MPSAPHPTIPGQFPSYQASPARPHEPADDQPSVEEQLERLEAQAIALLQAANTDLSDDTPTDRETALATED